MVLEVTEIAAGFRLTVIPGGGGGPVSVIVAVDDALTLGFAIEIAVSATLFGIGIVAGAV